MDALQLDDFRKWAEEDSLIIDTRKVEALRQGFIKGSLAMPLSEKLKDYALAFAGYEGAHIKDKNILFLLDESEKTRLFEKAAAAKLTGIKGYLSGGFGSWQKADLPVDIIIEVEPDELMMDIPFDENLVILDTRSEIVFGNGHLKNAVNIPLDQMNNPLRLSAIEETDNLYLIAHSDEEAYFAATVLKRHEIHNLRVVLGGWPAIQQEKRAAIVKEPGILN
ncbi:rhodanese-like domain-containing protein [Niabella insulamsoli]|uniref:rhodanese-like domain-containing protein n=1 Tax=Niabella insulamsoli TaxID=3144874 RepID=UPI0031FC4C45